MSACATFTRTWDMGRYCCTLSLPADASGQAAIKVLWTPQPPKRPTAAELAKYRSRRDETLLAWATSVDRSVAVVDL